MIATSSNLFDSLFVNQVNCFFHDTQYKYDCCYIQIGVHGKFKSYDGSMDATPELYRGNIIGLYRFLQQHCEKVIIETIFLTVKPKNKFLKYVSDLGLFKYVRWYVKDIPDAEINTFQNEKNEIIRSLKGMVQILDICNLMEKHKYKKYDHIHYERDAYNVIVQYMIEAIRNYGSL